MTKKRIILPILIILTFLFVTLIISSFSFRRESEPEVKAVSEQAAYIPTSYHNYGLPIAVALLSDGNLWYADHLNGRIVKVSPTGTVLRTVGRYGTNEGEFDGSLTGLTIDNDGNLYVQSANKTYKLDFNGGFLKSWGQPGNGEQDYANPQFITYDAHSDALFISDTDHKRILKFTTNGDYVSQFGSEGTGDGEFRSINGITTDSAGNIYAVDPGDFGQPNSRVQVFHPDGTFSRKFGTGLFVAGTGIAIRSNGGVVVASQNSQKIFEFDSAGNLLTSWGEWGYNSWQFLAPRSIVLDTSGNLFVTDWYLGAIVKFSDTGVFISSIRNSGFLEGNLTHPTSIAYDSAGNVYVLDNGAYEGRVQKFTNSGNYLSTIIQPPMLEIASYHIAIYNDELYVTDANGFRKFSLNGTQLLAVEISGTDNGQFREARGIAVDSDGDIYVVDAANSRIQKFDSSGNFLLNWGTVGRGNGEFAFPDALTIGPDHNLYIADNPYDIPNITDNTRIQVFDSEGVYIKTIGSFGSGDGQMNVIGGMAFDHDGNLQVSELFNTRIQIFDASGNFIRKYGEKINSGFLTWCVPYCGGIKMGSGVGEYSEPTGLALNPISGDISIADRSNHRVQLLPSGTRIYNLIDSADVLANNDNSSLVYRYFDPQSAGVSSISSRLYFGDYVVSDFSVNLTNDRDWINVNVLTIPNESKSLVVNLDPTNAPGISTSHSLYIVKQEGQTSVRVCPNALLLADITDQCSGGYNLAEGASSLTTVILGGKTYWKISGLTGTGVMSSIVTGTPTPSATATPTPTNTQMSTPSATPTPTITQTSAPSITPTPTTTIATSETPKITATPTLSPVVKGTTPECPIFTNYSASTTLVKKGDTVTFKWSTKNTSIVKSSFSEVELPAVGQLTISPLQSATIIFTAYNGYCISKKSSTLILVDTLPWTNTLTIGTGLLMVEAAIAFQQPAIFGNVWLALAGFISRKKRQTCGFVYNSETKRPLGRAILRLTQLDGTVIDTVVSEANGTFSLTPKVGKFTVNVKLAGYTFPSTVIVTDSDGGFSNIYRGQQLEITNTSKGILLSIPMDKAIISEAERNQIKKRALITKFIEVSSNILMITGLVYGMYTAFIFPHVYNYIILSAYLLLVIVKVVLLLPEQTVGYVKLSDGSPVSGIEIGLFDTEFKNLLYRTFTNKEGEYSFVVPNKNYHLKVLDDRYRIVSRKYRGKELPLRAEGSSAVRVVTENLTLE